MSIRSWHRPLVVNAALMFGLAVVSAGAMVFDDRVILGESVWVKPLKFGFAMGARPGAARRWSVPTGRRSSRSRWWGC
ncbi:hypothetical protein KZZ52_34600 [Dactylosporangium sp. AC04546]|uniref:hypothetical protein n=1 Tax=Dactylosporangium sp. AC04546 TaxID=2862460 RepID=UPI001EDFD571|nr:hypothetical protein [Dactylosporangium sp. AC04546]WVK89894.1 hypothetical protein KZZ52_34600 [Dactylosporangium sp. AC04546]